MDDPDDSPRSVDWLLTDEFSDGKSQMTALPPIRVRGFWSQCAYMDQFIGIRLGRDSNLASVAIFYLTTITFTPELHLIPLLGSPTNEDIGIDGLPSQEF